MKRIHFFVILSILISPFFISAQVTYKVVKSEKLQAERELKIQLPRNYNKNTGKKYPLVVVLDGDYLFEPVAGNIDYYSYWEDIPEAIVVGVNQIGSRESDTKVDFETLLPADEGALFFEFLGMELLPLLEKNYRIAPFKMIIGQNRTANFMNYYLFKDKSIFDAYINLSPDYLKPVHSNLANQLKAIDQKIWYYIATGSNDIPALHKTILATDKRLRTLENQKLFYYFDNIENATHYTLVGKAIPSALEQIFSVFRAYSAKDYEILLETNALVDHLIEKYKTIENQYGLAIKIRVSDFVMIAKAIEVNEKYDEYKELSKLAIKAHEKTMLGDYFEARYYETNGKPKKALRKYQVAFGKEEVAFINKDLILEKINTLKKDFGL